MRFNIFAFVAALAILAGCSETPQYMGAAVDHDQNVLTGGPITGTTLQDLPASVKAALKQREPHAEIASITRTHRDGNLIFEFSFLNSENPDIYVRDDGQVLPEPMRAQK